MKVVRFGVVLITLFGISALSGVSAPAQMISYPPELFSRAERTQYQETTLHKDIVNFANTLQKYSPLVQVETIATTKGGRPILLLVLSNPPVKSPQEAKRSGKPVIYIEANIHAGEVEGKEASLELMREIALGPRQYLLENQIILFNPDYNPDGNDSLSATSRSSQEGSPRLTGQRPSGEGYDLNRDALKLEAIESKGLMKNILLKWDPILLVDLHTTDGSWHGYSLTYAPSYLTAGHPATSNYTMDVMLPAVQKKVLERSGLPMFLYGDYRAPSQSGGEVRFSTYSHQPMYVTNSMGLRNRFAILAETFSHDRFEKRILSSKMFVLTILEYTNEHGKEMADIIRKAEEETINQVITNAGQFQKGVKFTMVPVDNKPFDLLIREMYADSSSGRRISRPTGRLIYLPNAINYNRFEPSKLSTVPRGYVFPAELKNAAEKLQEHGVKITTLDKTTKFTGEEFIISSFTQAGRPFQGHQQVTIAGAFQPAEKDFPAGSYVVDLAQPLAYLVFYMLEPESDNGLTYWNFFDDYLIKSGVEKGGVPHPVFKYYIDYKK